MGQRNRMERFATRARAALLGLLFIGAALAAAYLWRPRPQQILGPNEGGGVFKELKRPEQVLEVQSESGTFFNDGQDFVAKKGHKKPGGNPASDDLVRSGHSHVKQQEYEAAMSCFDKAIACDPANSNAHVHRGHLLMRLGKADQAIDDLNIALRIDPANDAAYVNRGYIYRERVSSKRR
jgi:tetratricopeptide (TPR) repeat protein